MERDCFLLVFMNFRKGVGRGVGEGGLLMQGVNLAEFRGCKVSRVFVGNTYNDCRHVCLRHRSTILALRLLSFSFRFLIFKLFLYHLR